MSKKHRNNKKGSSSRENRKKLKDGTLRHAKYTIFGDENNPEDESLQQKLFILQTTDGRTAKFEFTNIRRRNLACTLYIAGDLSRSTFEQVCDNVQKRLKTVRLFDEEALMPENWDDTLNQKYASETENEDEAEDADKEDISEEDISEEDISEAPEEETESDTAEEIAEETAEETED